MIAAMGAASGPVDAIGYAWRIASPDHGWRRARWMRMVMR